MLGFVFFQHDTHHITQAETTLSCQPVHLAISALKIHFTATKS
jgi:hypothetical protein